MKQLLSFVAAAMLTVSAAQGQVSLETPELSLLTVPSLGGEGGADGFTLLSRSNGVTEIALGTLATLSNVTADGGTEVIGQSAQSGQLYQSFVNTTVHSGFVVTGYSLSGVWVGQLQSALPADPAALVTGDPIASNSGEVDIGLQSTSVGSLTFFDEVQDLQGSRVVQLGERNLNLTGSFAFEIYGSFGALAQVGDYFLVEGGPAFVIPASAALRFDNAVLTIYTQPVPEPAVTLLFAVGFSVLVLVVRRRDRHVS